MIVLDALVCAVSWLADRCAPSQTKDARAFWAQELPLVKGDPGPAGWTFPSEDIPCSHAFGDDHPCARCGRPGGNVIAEPTAAFEPMPGWFRGGFDDEESSASSGSTSLAGVDAHAEGPTPGAAHTPGVGQPSVTAALRVSAAIGLREYADGCNCEAPTFWRNIADQLDPK